MNTANLAPVLTLEHAEKSFGAVHALEDGDIELFGGEVHGLVGENGAGKSTLVKILAGVHRPDGGRLVLDREEAIFDNTKQSQAAGIAIIFQEPTLFPDLSVAENIFVGMQPLKRFRRIDARRMRREAAAVFEQLGVRLDPDRLARGLSIDGLTIQSVIRAMVGRDMEALFPKVPAEPGRVILKVDRLTREGVFTDVSFDVRSGEIVALAGLVGAGRTEVARAIFGIDRWDAGSVEVDGRRLPPGSPTAAMAAGIGLVPEDRRQQGLVMDFSIERNIALASLPSVRRAGLIPRGAERRFARDWALRLQLRYSKLTNPVWTLSGGNQQKAVLAKWLARKPTLLIVDEPTRGIDVGTKAEVPRLLSELAASGR